MFTKLRISGGNREGVELLMKNITGIRRLLGLPGNHVRLIRDYFKALERSPRLSLAAFGRMHGLSKGFMSRIMCRSDRAGLVERIGATWILRVDVLRDLAAGRANAVKEHLREAWHRVARRKALMLQAISENVARRATHAGEYNSGESWDGSRSNSYQRSPLVALLVAQGCGKKL